MYQADDNECGLSTSKVSGEEGERLSINLVRRIKIPIYAGAHMQEGDVTQHVSCATSQRTAEKRIAVHVS
jgi:hypothetical protein